MEVAVARWPAERERVEDLRVRGVPRLLFLEGDTPAPGNPDCLEDWIRSPASDADVETRIASLRRRGEMHGARPTIDEDGLLRHNDLWVSLSPVERRIAIALIERYQAVVTRDVLAERAWPEGVPTRNALDVHVLRLRRRLAPLGLEIRTVRARGYLLQPGEVPQPAPPPGSPPRHAPVGA